MATQTVAAGIMQLHLDGRMDKATTLRVLTCQRQTQIEAMNLWDASWDIWPEVRALDSAIASLA